MANRRELGPLLAIAAFTALTAVSGMYLGFVAPRAMPHGKPVPRVPDQGAILYDMHSIYSAPDRVRLEWRDIPGASGYRVTVMTPDDKRLFTSPVLPRNSWVIPNDPQYPLSPATTYHWTVTVIFSERSDTSDAASFATQ